MNIEMGNMWKALSEQDKQYWKDQCQKNKERIA